MPSLAPAVASSSARPPRPATPAPLPAMSGSWLAAQGRLPLAFMGLGLAWLAIATAMVALRPDVLTMAHPAPPVVALAHAWVLGFFVTIATGATYQIAPVALGTTLWSERYGWWHFALQAVGVGGMVYAFWQWDMALLGHFAAAFALGVALFTVNTWRTVWRSGRRDPVAWSLLLGSTWLALTVLAGLLLAANRSWYFLPLDLVSLLRAHAHLGLVGFFVTLLQGVTFRLIPMFTLGDVPDWRPVRAGLWLSQLGLLGLAPALAWHRGWFATVFGGMIFVGIAFSAGALKKTLGTRKKRLLDPGIAAFLRGGAVLALAAIAGLALACPATPWNSAPGGFNAMVYGLIVILGGLLPAIGGMLCKIVPFLTWMRAYGPKVGRMPTPAAGALGSSKLEAWAFGLQGLAVFPLVAGAWLLNQPALRVGGGLLALGVALLLVDMARVMKHLWHPVLPATLSKPKSP